MSKRRKIITIILVPIVLLFWFCLPDPLFDVPFSSVAYSKDGQLLGARIAADGQWRFPAIGSIPKKYATAIVAFEDERFYYHPGVDPIAINRAIVQNVRSGEIESGASTLTMQVLRLSRRSKKRNIKEKIIEMFMALRLDLTTSKSDILALHSAHAPYGCNIVGLNAACWRYFGKSPNKLSWAEASLLAVLPNAPSLMHPGKNRSSLKKKRDRLLEKLLNKGKIDRQDFLLACAEEIPLKPKPLPHKSYHLVEELKRRNISNSTIDISKQEMLYDLSSNLSEEFSQNGINNLAALITDTQSGEVLAYIGNSQLRHANQYVDMIRAPRSSGSILKPILHAYMINEGLLMPDQLIEDAPVSFGGFNPQNFNKTFSGAVPASEALIRSLNVPAVHNLRNYGVEKFLNRLRELNFSTVPFSAEHYGLSLILGGGEVTLWDLSNAYAFLGRTLLNYRKHQSQYDSNDFRSISLATTSENTEPKLSFEASHLNAGAIWHTFEAMSHLRRPNEEGDWEQFSSSSRIAWKTGTSFGHRDAWAVGVNPDYTIAVWVGNADGEGRKDNIGTKTAGRFLFDILNRLPRASQWFVKPYDDMIELPICKKSGQLAYTSCDEVENKFIYDKCERTRACQYHHLLTMDGTMHYQVNSSCNNLSESVKKSWFTLPPTMAHYYKKQHPDYKHAPPFHPSCKSAQQEEIAFIYPAERETIFIPKDLDGEKQKLVCKVSHNDPETQLFWHINNTFYTSTKEFHTIELDLEAGACTVLVIDEDGNEQSRKFEVLGE